MFRGFGVQGLAFRVEGLGLRCLGGWVGFSWFLMFGMGFAILSPIMENQLEKTMEHESTILGVRVWVVENQMERNGDSFFVASVKLRRLCNKDYLSVCFLLQFLMFL